jgi:hypothetical protein
MIEGVRALVYPLHDIDRETVASIGSALLEVAVTSPGDTTNPIEEATKISTRLNQDGKPHDVRAVGKLASCRVPGTDLIAVTGWRQTGHANSPGEFSAGSKSLLGSNGEVAAHLINQGIPLTDVALLLNA